jgi:hypothetical protein
VHAGFQALVDHKKVDVNWVNSKVKFTDAEGKVITVHNSYQRGEAVTPILQETTIAI